MALVLSDVIGDPLEFIASGPTFYSGNKNQAALEILNRYQLLEHLPRQFLQHLQDEQQKSDDEQMKSVHAIAFELNRVDTLHTYLYSSQLRSKDIHNLIVGSNRIALEAAARLCHQSLVYVPFIATTCLRGEARDMGRRIVELLTTQSSRLTYNSETACLFSDQAMFDAFRIFVDEQQRFCLLLGGETTVVIKDQAGKGGRCQELALAAALAMVDQTDETSMVLLAAGSDGIDGPTDAAGAYAFRGMIVNDEDKSLALTALEEHDAYTYFSETHHIENLLKVGHTNTNVMDLILVLVDKKKTHKQ